VESKVQGRSAFITSAILLYLRAKREKLIDDQLIAVISKQGNEMANEGRPLVAAQSFSPDDGDDLIEHHEPEARYATRGHKRMATPLHRGEVWMFTFEAPDKRMRSEGG